MDWIMPVPSPSTEEKWGSKKLHRLFEQVLKLHKSPRMDEENNEKIGTNCGIRNHMTNKNKELCCVNWRESRAAVLICLFEGSEGELRVILTKRSMNLASHPENKGDVALPGGKMEESDEDDTATALREATEEIGLDPSLVHVVVNLEPFMSQHQLKVIPVIGIIDRIQEFKPLLNTSEVDAVFHVPLDMFLKEENHRFEEREWMGLKYVLHLFNFESSDQKGEMMIICGLTASILIRAASVMYQRSPCFQASLPDFQQLQRALSPT